MDRTIQREGATAASGRSPFLRQMGNRVSPPGEIPCFSAIFWKKNIDFFVDTVLLWYGCPQYAFFACPFCARKARKSGGARRTAADRTYAALNAEGGVAQMEALLRQAGRRVVGTKQVLRAVEEGRAAHVFLGRDADGFIYHRLNALCEERRVPVTVVDSMQELGKLCQVDVKAASAAVLK